MRDVAAVYLDAAVHHDCTTTQALTTGATPAWCTDPTMTSYRNVTGPTLLQQPGRDLQRVSFTMTNTESAEHSLNPATRPWSLCFARSAAGWRVADQGFL
ncbi:hypothetical protein [Lapillicoccus jejuensis]|uniref:Uncharacterized protein n=1 Tax=Lapillicoccus jejuensis TaxID=402171 RepID=A0A542E3M5_9MICO|nr:hypothetical protein [Lapillicoccus jejuensis]TQJ09941.1 hypothetical protein FB458_3057 [Lapillicoccus jejuensis]